MAEGKDAEESKEKFKNIKNIISIDFGSWGCTSYYCLPQLSKEGKRIYSVERWKGFTSLNSLDPIMKKKTLTALLYDYKNNKVISFGWHALKQYKDYKKYQNMINHGNKKGKEKMQGDFLDEDAKLAYFDHFKPHLLENNQLKKDTVDKYIYPIDYDQNDINAPKLSILDLITYSLIEIKKQSLKEAQTHRQDAGLDGKEAEELKEDEVLWVVGTPAVWDDNCRGAFNKCIENAGMTHYEVGLEPELALFFTKYYDEIELLKNDEASCKTFKQGKQYLVLDCGAGTTDVTIVKVQNDNRFEEVVSRTGDNIGCLMIDNEYYQLLDKIFGQPFMTRFKQKYPDTWNKMRIKFWKAKHDVTVDKKSWNVELYAGSNFEKELESKCKENDIKYDDDIEEHINSLCSKVSDGISYDDGFLQINIDIWQEFHQQLLNKICTLLKNNIGNCKDVIVCGGFSASSFLRWMLTKEFTDTTCHYVTMASKAVAIGGLYRATYVEDLVERRMWLTYGIEVSRNWEQGDDESMKYMNQNTGQYMKRHGFHTIICKNDRYKVDEEHKEQYSLPIAAQKLQLNVFSVDDEKGVDSITDKACQVAAHFELLLTNQHKKKSMQSELPVTLIFKYGRTMINIYVKIDDEIQKMRIRIKQSDMLHNEGNKTKQLVDK